MSKSIAIVGLGLIGGSVAMALQGFEGDSFRGCTRVAALAQKLERSAGRKRKMNRHEQERNR